MTWLARIELDAEIVGHLRIIDSYDWHQHLWDCFPEAPDHKRDFLTSVEASEGAFRIWILAERKPVCPTWCSSRTFAVKKISPTFLSHKYYVFSLKANPTRALVRRASDGTPVLKTNGKRASGKRIPLLARDDLKAWLQCKGTVGGFRISEEKPLDIGPMVENYFQKKGASGYHGGVQFRGILEVTDKTLFEKTWSKGIGSAKAFGFGLLLISPVELNQGRSL